MSVGIRKHVKNSGNKIKAMQNSSSDDSHTSNNHDDMFRSCCRTQISVISCHVFRDVFPSCLPYNHHLLTQLTALWWHQQKLFFIICRAECSNWGIKVLDVHNNRNFQTWVLIKIQLTIFIAVGSFKQRKSCFEEKWHRVKIKFSTLQSFWGAGFSQFYFSSSHQTRLASTTKYFLLFLCQVHAWEMAYLASSSSFLSCVNEMCDEFRQL